MREDLQTELATLCRRHARSIGLTPTAVDGLFVACRTQKGEKRSFSEPYAAIVLQGRKCTYVNNTAFAYGAGNSVITCVDLPTETVIEEASADVPFLSVVVRLNRKLLSELALQQGGVAQSAGQAGIPLLVQACPDELADNALRLLRLLDTPDQIALLGPVLMREFHARLLLGPQGAWLREVCAFGSKLNQISKAIGLIKEGFASDIRTEDLAREVNMSTASFHRHFKAVTGCSPIRYQKILRLYEARRCLTSGRSKVLDTAYSVGYASASQFTKDHRDFFGVAPSRDSLEA